MTPVFVLALYRSVWEKGFLTEVTDKRLIIENNSPDFVMFYRQNSLHLFSVQGVKSSNCALNLPNKHDCLQKDSENETILLTLLKRFKNKGLFIYSYDI